MNRIKHAIGKCLCVLAIIVAIALALPFAANELITKIDTNTGRKTDLIGREISSEDRHHRTLSNPFSRLYDWAYYLAGGVIVCAMWYTGEWCSRKP